MEQLGQSDRLKGSGERVAFFGGSFDPPHEGHLAIARAAQEALRLNRVLFAPVGEQPLKPEGSTASFDERLEMTRLAIAHDPGFVVSTVDAPKANGEPNYTMETLLQLRAELVPGGSLFFLMGSDSFFGLRRWRRAAEIPFTASLIVASRPGQPLEDLRSALPAGLTMEGATMDFASAVDAHASAGALQCFTLRKDGGATAPLYLLKGLAFDVSASNLREQIQGTPGWFDSGPQHVPGPVMEFIQTRRLYR